MKVFQRGEGDPELAVVGSVHGDEPVGKKAIKKLLQQEIEFQKPVEFVIANEKALKIGKRFVDTDLNRSFPGDSQSHKHEERLASRLLDRLEGLKVLDIHSTHSYGRPFATCTSFEGQQMEIIEASGVDKAVKFSEDVRTLANYVDGVVVEAGYQSSDKAVENALGVIRNFLAYFGAIEREHQESEVDFFVEHEKVEGDWDFVAENFKQVQKGEVYARRDDEELVAEERFCPVLMSTNGYNGVLGHKASKVMK